jgi:DNA-binding GntR family transcriptional regulator
MLATRRLTVHVPVDNGGVAWESDVLAAHHRLSSEPMYLLADPETRSPAWAKCHIEFHHARINACGSTLLLDLCVRLSDSAELYRAWSVSRGETNRDIAGEHKALLDAAIAHDADAAVSLYRQHVGRTVESVLQLEHDLIARPEVREHALSCTGRAGEEHGDRRGQGFDN